MGWGSKNQVIRNARYLLKVKKGSWSVQWNVFSAFNPSLSSSGQPQRSAWGPTPHSEPAPRSRVLTGDRLIHMCLMVGGTRSTRRNPQSTGRTCKLHTERSYHSRESNPCPRCYEASVLITEPPCHLTAVFLLNEILKKFWSSLLSVQRQIMRHSDDENKNVNAVTAANHLNVRDDCQTLQAAGTLYCFTAAPRLCSELCLKSAIIHLLFISSNFMKWSVLYMQTCWCSIRNATERRCAAAVALPVRILIVLFSPPQMWRRHSEPDYEIFSVLHVLTERLKLKRFPLWDSLKLNGVMFVSAAQV